jgi:hypothetical protein
MSLPTSGVANPEEWLAKAKLVQRIAGGGRTHTFGLRRAGAKLKTPRRLPTQRHRSLARQARFRGMGMGRNKPESRRMNVTFSSSRGGNRHEHELSILVTS